MMRGACWLGLSAIVAGCFLPDFERLEGKTVSTTSSGPGAGPGGQGTGGDSSGGGGGGGAGTGGGVVGPGGAGATCEPPAMGGSGGGDPCVGKPGPEMVRIPAEGGGTYCIDATEVTNAHYAAFLATSPSVMGQPAHCAWNTDFTPMGWMGVVAGEEALPVVNVDWCDAAAYCAYAGKRLCGKVGGGPGPHDLAMADPVNEQWFRACSVAGTQLFPYPGETFQPMACNGKDYGAGKPIAVGTAVGCEGGYCGMFDMAGNVGEWVDQCDDMTGANDNCFALGGTFNGTKKEALSCLTFADIPRDSFDAALGFRCCIE